jgi:hypothetical protein
MSDFSRKFIFVSFLLVILCVCIQIGFNHATKVQHNSLSSAKPVVVAETLLWQANSYVMDNFESIFEGRDVVVGGSTLKAGAGVGQSLSPSSEQLNSMGYSKAGVEIDNGLVTVKLVPSNCHGHACSVEVRAAFGGACKMFTGSINLIKNCS